MNRRSYGTDFEELERLGGGGQGSVYKALHHLDRKEYAVKKVHFNKKREKELLREVQALSALSHSNIVRYHSSWTEDGDSSDDESDQVQSESASCFTQSENEESVEGNSPRDAAGKDSVKGQGDTEGQSGKTSQGTNSEVCSSILYIQMELCTSTLRKWIEKRNASSSSGGALTDGQEEIMDIFRQILRGVEYIHKQGLIHRDLKPENIFLQKDNSVKIGDFGLAKGCISEEEEAQSAAFLNGSRGRYGVGTPPYAAPEMLSCEEYDEKSDVYSLGVIFLEMFHKMSTVMEVMKVVQNLQNGCLPAEVKKKKAWKKQANAVKKMAQKEAKKRPSATELLCGPLFLDQEQEITMLRERVKRKNALIKHLRERLRKASPYLLQTKLKRANALLKIKSAQIERLQKGYNSPDLESLISSVPKSVPLSGIRFQSKKEKDFFARMCKGMCALYRMFEVDLMYLIAGEVLSYGIEGWQEFLSQTQFEMVLQKCFEVAHQLTENDHSWISKRETEQFFTLRALVSHHGGHNRQPAAQEAPASTKPNAGKRRRRRSKRQGSQQLQQRNEDG